jgi:lipopolysaccharide/colanic/teichoic acid biosynthesis glycosyltransferase
VVETKPSLSESFIRRAQDSPRRGGVDMALRVLDVSLSLVFLAIAGLPMVAIAVAIVTTTGRPVLYRGQRVGLGGRFYTMLKFRTLRAGAEERLGPYLGQELVARTKEERTTVGRWLRATQLDELPQLFNVLKGEMSLVGPRPIRPIFFERLASDIPAYWQRLVVRPGLTGFAQVRRGYETSMEEKLAHDLEWIADRSVGLYLRTLGATGVRVLSQSVRGAVRPTKVE